MACPSVHVLSVLSTRDDILQSSVLDVLAEVLRSCSPTTPCGPYVPDVQPQHLPRHVENTRPDFVVLVSEYDALLHIDTMPNRKKEIQDLLSAVKCLETTKMIFIVASEGDLSLVQRKVKEINQSVLRDDNIMVLHLQNLLSNHHQDLVKVLRSFKPKLYQTLTSSCLPQCEDAVKGLLRYSAVIQNGCILAVLHCDPFYWEPSKRMLESLLEDSNERRTINLWEDSNGSITVIVKKAVAAVSQQNDENEEEDSNCHIPCEDRPSLSSKCEYHPVKGYLTFRAKLVNGKIDKVMVCEPPDWKPDPLDLKFLEEKYDEESKAILEFWRSSLDEPPSMLLVRTKTDKTPFCFSLPKPQKLR